MHVGPSDAATPRSSVGKPGLRMCGVTWKVQPRPRRSDGLGGCDECDPLPSAYPDANADVVMMSGMCGSPVDVDPEVALRELVSALRARHHTPPGQRPVQTNGWTAADEFELIMRRWRATLDRGKMGEKDHRRQTQSRRVQKALVRLKKYLQERMPSQVVEAIWNVTAAQLSPDPVRSAVMECTDPDNSKRAAALKARTTGAEMASTTRPVQMTISRLLSTSTSQHATGAGGQHRAVDRARGPAAAPCLLALAGRPYRSVQIGGHRLRPRRACHRASAQPAALAPPSPRR